MRRDLELIRKVALFYEQAETPWVDTAHGGLRRRDGRFVKGLLPDIAGYGDNEIEHALAIMIDSGLVVENAEFLGASSGMPTAVLGRRLGWAGHEFLDALRDEEAFNRVSDAADKARNWTIQFMLEAAKRFAFQQIGL